MEAIPKRIMPPETRIAVIEDSLRCYVYSWLSLVPILGSVFAVLALRRYSMASMRSAGYWNPAVPYARAGSFIGGIGGLLSAFEFGGLMLLLWTSQG